MAGCQHGHVAYSYKNPDMDGCLPTLMGCQSRVHQMMVITDWLTQDCKALIVLSNCSLNRYMYN